MNIWTVPYSQEVPNDSERDIYKALLEPLS